MDQDSKISNKTILIFSIIFGILVTLALIMHARVYKHNVAFNVHLFSFIVATIISFIAYKVIILLRVYFNKSIHPLRYYNRRLILVFISSNLICILITNIIIAFFSFFHLLGQNTYSSNIFSYSVISIIISSTLVLGIELKFYLMQWKDSLLKTQEIKVLSEKLEKENIYSQYTALKNQVNPDFLFNSLSVLNALIKPEPEKAETFIAKFSYHFRYILAQKDKSLTTVRDEIKFIFSFLHLQKLRKGNGLEYSIEINNDSEEDFILSLSLYLLLQNAFKHNVASYHNPLKISIYGIDDYIVVQNNIQKRKSIDPSLGLGLKNLKERYVLISRGKEPIIEVSKNDFMVKLPIIKDY